MFIVFDLDGTLANAEHRIHHIQGAKKDWAAFYAACVNDTLIRQMGETMYALCQEGHRVEIWSGRSDEVEAETLKWLMGHGFSLPLRMRSRGDHRPDTVIKALWMELHGKPDLVFEDRASVVKMYREHGVVCCQVADGVF